jgi:ubiquinone/menaquinone biosynthesis C-methylase UbiE
VLLAGSQGVADQFSRVSNQDAGSLKICMNRFINERFLSLVEWIRRRIAPPPAPDHIAMPPREFMELVCGREENLVEQFKWAGAVVTRMLEDESMLMPGTSFLDVGCGCGRVARFLLQKPIGSYTGFDRHPGMIQWCRENISRHVRNFDFQYHSVSSAYKTLDGHDGTQPAGKFIFPYQNESFDAVLLASIFTHMPLEESAHYLKELYRVVRLEGKVLLSVFLTDGEPHSNGVDFHYNSKGFLSKVAEAGFAQKLKEELRGHHWYILFKPSSKGIG